jgi:hypothetical protein
VTSQSPRLIASANARTTGIDNGRFVVFASSHSAALFGVMLCTLLRTRKPLSNDVERDDAYRKPGDDGTRRCPANLASLHRPRAVHPWRARDRPALDPRFRTALRRRTTRDQADRATDRATAPETEEAIGEEAVSDNRKEAR